MPTFGECFFYILITGLTLISE